MFQGLRWRLLSSYLMVMAAILSLFGTGVYVFFSRSLYWQLDKKLMTLAQAAAPSLAEVKNNGSDYIDRLNEVPWRDLFNYDQQSLEWFDDEGQILASRGTLALGLPPKTGVWTLELTHDSAEIRTFTVSVFQDSTQPNEPSLGGYIRASQSTEGIKEAQNQLLWGLGAGGAIAFALVSMGAVWLTRKSLEPVELSFKQLKQFTADASHELRGPLTAIGASVDVMCNHPERIHPKDAKKIAAIANATTQMSHLIDDLLFLARTDAAVAVAGGPWELTSLNQLLQNSIDLLEPFAQDKDVALKYYSSVEVAIVGNAAQLSRLFANLIENSLQYTPSGGKVIVSLTKHNYFAVIKVEDTGIGIAPEQIPFIFDRFWRADKARSRRQGGSGLGLSIASAIAQSHGGRITVTSQVDVGSCFQVRLPTRGAAKAGA